VGELDVLILATPVPSIINYLHQLQNTNYHLPLTILDLGSTKRDILQAMSALPENFDPIGGHPICGREKLGLENADPNLYRDAPFVITPLERTTQRRNTHCRATHLCRRRASHRNDRRRA
jgi:prephenate dehydrogenase